ncbi:hypothetical protein PMAYCL1PPCAC_14736, partial [Pristionchus mayeri]
VRDFTVLCMRLNGSYAPIDSSKVVFYSLPHEQAAINESQALVYLSTNDRGMASYGVNTFRLVDNGRKVVATLDLSCNAGYRQECPAVENYCQYQESTSERDKKTIRIDHTGF